LHPADADAALPNPSPTYRGLDEHSAQCLGAAHSPIGKMLDAENAADSLLGTVRHRGTVNVAGDDLLREIRRLAALDARNRSALDALERYLQLADAESRRALYVAGVAAFDQFRLEAPKIQAAGLPVPKDDELHRQRAKLLADLASLDATIGLLNHDLSAKLAMTLGAKEQFWPLLRFMVVSESPDAQASVKHALAMRADLQLLRTLLQRTSPETLPAIRDSLKTFSGLLGASPMPMPLSVLRRKPEGASPQERAEVEPRRKQLAELLVARESETAAQVHTAIGQLTASSQRTALLQCRVVSLEEKLSKSKTANQVADVLTNETDVLKAKAEVVSAAIEWHQWRVKLKAAQGFLASECLTQEPVQALPAPTGPIPVRVHSMRFAQPSR